MQTNSISVSELNSIDNQKRNSTTMQVQKVLAKVNLDSKLVNNPFVEIAPGLFQPF
jgi:hypothetical protein